MSLTRIPTLGNCTLKWTLKWTREELVHPTITPQPTTGRLGARTQPNPIKPVFFLSSTNASHPWRKPTQLSSYTRSKCIQTTLHTGMSLSFVPYRGEVPASMWGLVPPPFFLVTPSNFVRVYDASKYRSPCLHTHASRYPSTRIRTRICTTYLKLLRQGLNQ